jgi:hypothetical protein
MQIRVDVLAVEVRMLKHSNDLFQLCSSPPAVCALFELNTYRYVLVCTVFVSVRTFMYLHIRGMYWNCTSLNMLVQDGVKSLPSSIMDGENRLPKRLCVSLFDLP